MFLNLQYGVFVVSIAVLATRVYGQAITQGSYTPHTNVPCPANLTRLVNDNTTVDLDSRELEYISARRALLPAAWSQWIGNGSQIGYTPEQLGLSDPGSVPVIGIASSGGGFR
jgi:lysophospholipase